MVGVVLVAYGLWRAEAVRPWVATVLAAAAIIVFGGQVTDNRIIFAVAFAIYVIALAPVGWRILSEPDDGWARGPPSATATPARGETA